MTSPETETSPDSPPLPPETRIRSVLWQSAEELKAYCLRNYHDRLRPPPRFPVPVPSPAPAPALSSSETEEILRPEPQPQKGPALPLSPSPSSSASSLSSSLDSAPPAPRAERKQIPLLNPERFRFADEKTLREQDFSGSPPLLLIILPPPAEPGRALFAMEEEEQTTLLRWLSSIELRSKEDCFLIRLHEHYLPGNRPLFSDETNLCRRRIKKILEILRPRAVLGLGEQVSLAFSGETASLASPVPPDREFRGHPLFLTFTQGIVKQYPPLKRPVWETLKKLKSRLSS